MYKLLTTYTVSLPTIIVKYVYGVISHDFRLGNVHAQTDHQGGCMQFCKCTLEIWDIFGGNNEMIRESLVHHPYPNDVDVSRAPTLMNNLGKIVSLYRKPRFIVFDSCAPVLQQTSGAHGLSPHIAILLWHREWNSDQCLTLSNVFS